MAKKASNEWYDLFELRLLDNKSAVCTAFQKPDAQLGIGITLDIASMANDRNFNFFMIAKADLGEEQMKPLEKMLPDDVVSLSCVQVDFLVAIPKNTDQQVIDVKHMVKLLEMQTKTWAEL